MTEGKNKAAILTEISLILAAIFWGTNYAATKFAALSIPPLSIVALSLSGLSGLSGVEFAGAGHVFYAQPCR